MRAASGFWAETRSATFTCPVCAGHSGVRFVPGKLWFGYTSAAGTAHFSADEEYAAPEITGTWVDAAGWHVRIGRDQELIIPQS